MARSGARDLSVGAMLALALVILAAAVMALGDSSSLFGRRAGYSITFPNADGLVVGSPVKMSGVQVGSVSGIVLSTDPAQPGIRVAIKVDPAYADRVREDSGAALRILQLLSGEKYVELVPGSHESPVLPPGSDIVPVQDPEILKQAAVATENLNDITVSLKNILQALEDGDGLIGKMINDPSFGRSGVEALSGAMENLRAITADLLRGEGFVGRMLYDEEFAGKIDDLGAAIESMARVMGDLSLDEGAVGEMLREDGKGKQIVDDLAVASAAFARIATGLEEGDGLVARLVGDEEYSARLADDLGRILSNTAEITEKINTGQGTLGALVNERQLHSGLEQVVAGVNDSKFARWLLRRYRKKGIEAADRDAEE